MPFFGRQGLRLRRRENGAKDPRRFRYLPIHSYLDFPDCPEAWDTALPADRRSLPAPSTVLQAVRPRAASVVTAKAIFVIILSFIPDRWLSGCL